MEPPATPTPKTPVPHLVERCIPREDDGLVRALHAAAAQARQVRADAHGSAADQRDGEALAPRTARGR